MNQRVAGFVAAAKQVVGIRPITDSDDHLIFAPALGHGKKAFKPSGNMDNHVTAKSLDGSPADSKALIVKAGHAPENKAHRHRDCFSRTDRAVADNAVFTLVLLHLPPKQRHLLPLAESPVNHQSPPLRRN